MAEETKPGNIYKFAFQKKPRKPVHVYTLREDDPSNINRFCKRIAEVDSLATLMFAEIQRIDNDGTVSVIYGNATAEWPRGAKIVTHSGILSENKNSSRRRVSSPATINTGNKQLPVITPPSTPGLVTRELADANVAFTLPLKIKVA